MRVRKLLDWRKLLIYSHRWLGIALGVGVRPLDVVYPTRAPMRSDTATMSQSGRSR